MTKRTMRVSGRPRLEEKGSGESSHSSKQDGPSQRGGRRARRSDRILNHGLDEVLRSRKSLSTRLMTLGLRIKDITGDGNCLFRAVSMLLNGSESGHRDLRELACRTLILEKELFKPFVMDSTVEEHVEKMCQPKEYGGHLELAALANALHVNIVVHHTTSDTSQIQKPFHPHKAKVDQPVKQTIHLVYDSNCLHYDSTIKVNGSTGRALELFDQRHQSDEKGDRTLPPVFDEMKEKLVLASCPTVPITRIRTLLSGHDGLWEDVVEALVDEQVEEDEDRELRSTIARLGKVQTTSQRSTESPATTSSTEELISKETDLASTNDTSVVDTPEVEDKADEAGNWVTETASEVVISPSQSTDQSTDKSSNRSASKRKRVITGGSDIPLLSSQTTRSTPKHRPPRKASFRKDVDERQQSPLVIRPVRKMMMMMMMMDSDDIDPLAILPSPNHRPRSKRKQSAKGSPTTNRNLKEDQDPNLLEGTVGLKVRRWLDDHWDNDLDLAGDDGIPAEDEGRGTAESRAWKSSSVEDSDSTVAMSEETLQRMTSTKSV